MGAAVVTPLVGEGGGGINPDILTARHRGGFNLPKGCGCTIPCHMLAMLALYICSTLYQIAIMDMFACS